MTASGRLRVLLFGIGLALILPFVGGLVRIPLFVFGRLGVLR
ncbi:hypothetical protein [Actinoplanes palleronii]|nr:hypothetical protein [Actinoplanes palleronii]